MAIDKNKYGNQYEEKIKLYEEAIREIKHSASVGAAPFSKDTPQYVCSNILDIIQELEGALD